MRRLLLWMARNEWLRTNLPRFWFARRAVRRFMPGEKPEQALEAAQKFKALGTGILFTRLGENLKRIEDADATAEDYFRLMADAHERGIDAEASVKLTQLGFDIDVERTLEHCQRLAGQAAAQGKILWLDMEASDYTESTIAFYERLKKTHPNSGICLQAYLKRTYTDIERLLPIGLRVRLVKGAYAEPDDVAYGSRKEVDANYLALVASMLAAKKAGTDVFIGLGTHDVELVRMVADHAQSLGLSKADFDVEMLYGIRADQQRKLAADGYKVRVLIAYGDYWYPWYMRRLAERPANVVFALRQLLP
ncbi:MAG TPA: proline dehydrogenase family protein [Aeromicrobium sp.]|nr:proline dehydrogenase family protein [Aeromicrobium sp.]